MLLDAFHIVNSGLWTLWGINLEVYDCEYGIL